MAKRKRQVRKVQKTLLLVGEGKLDTAFLKYLKTLYDRNPEQKVTVRSADGGSPADVIHSAIKRKDISYDRRYVLIDSDVPLTQKDITLAQSKKVGIIQSVPTCLEGMLLTVLAEKPPSTNCDCKKALHAMLADPALPQSYANLFTKAVLDNSDVATIKQLIALF